VEGRAEADEGQDEEVLWELKRKWKREGGKSRRRIKAG